MTAGMTTAEMTLNEVPIVVPARNTAGIMMMRILRSVVPDEVLVLIAVPTVAPAWITAKRWDTAMIAAPADLHRMAHVVRVRK